MEGGGLGWRGFPFKKLERGWVLLRPAVRSCGQILRGEGGGGRAGMADGVGIESGGLDEVGGKRGREGGFCLLGILSSTTGARASLGTLLFFPMLRSA